MKNCLNFAWLEENVSVPVSWEGKTEEEYSMCVGDCIDSDRDRFSAKGVFVVYVPIRPVTVPTLSVSVHVGRKSFQHC